MVHAQLFNEILQSLSFTYCPALQCISCTQHQSAKARGKPAKHCSHGVPHTYAHTHNHTVHTHTRRVSSFPILHAHSFPLHSSSFVSVFIFHDQQLCSLRAPSLKLQIHPFLHLPAVTGLYIKPCSKITVHTGRSTTSLFIAC